MLEQIADDGFSFDLLVDPALTRRTPCRLADVELFGLSLQVAFAGPERPFLSRGPVRERLLFGPEFVSLGLKDLSHLVEFAALVDQRVAQSAVVAGELLLGLVEPLLSNLRSAGLSHLRPRFFNGHAPFECRAVRLFQFGTQAVEPFAAAFQVLSVQREHVLLAAQISQLPATFAVPLFAFESDPLAVMFGELLEGPLRFEEHLPFAIDGAFAFLQQRPHAIELRLPQPDDRFALFELAARTLGLASEFILSRFDFLPSFRQMFLLKPQPVFEDRPFVSQFSQLLLTLTREGVLCFLEFRLLSLLCHFQCGELRLLLCQQFLTHVSDRRDLDFTSMIEFRPFAVTQCDEFGTGEIELVSLADQRCPLGTQFGGEDFFGDILPNARLGGFDFLQLCLISLFEKLPLPIKFHLPALTIHVRRGNRLLQAFAFGGDLRADVCEQAGAVGFQLLAALGEIGLFGTKLLDHPLLRGDLFGERCLALPQNLGGGLQILIGLLLPQPQAASVLIELLKLRCENLIASLQLGDLNAQLIDKQAGLAQHFTVPLWRLAAELVRRRR